MVCGVSSVSFAGFQRKWAAILASKYLDDAVGKSVESLKEKGFFDHPLKRDTEFVHWLTSQVENRLSQANQDSIQASEAGRNPVNCQHHEWQHLKITL